MPDEFKLRPYSTDRHIEHPLDAVFGADRDRDETYDDAHEQGARALAAAIIEKHFARLRVLQDAGCHTEAMVAQDCINDIHRLVPPVAGKENA